MPPGSGAAPPGERRPFGLSREWFESIRLTLVTRAVFFGVSLGGAWFLSSGSGAPGVAFRDMWLHWDALHFLEVAVYGYTDPSTDPHATAFFPLFPLTIRVLGALVGSPFAAAMVIVTGATIVAGTYLQRLASLDARGSGPRALLYLLLFPTALFLVAPYSEALFLAGAIPAFYYARRGRWTAAALPAAVAVATRAAGIFLVFGLVLEYVRVRRSARISAARAATAIAVALLPLAAYIAYLWMVKGDPLYFFVDQRVGWGRELTAPWEALARTWDLAGNPDQPTYFIAGWRVELAAAAVGIVATAYAMLVREWGYAGYMGATMAALMTSTAYLSIPRMLLSLFPIVLFLARWTNGSPGRHQLVLTAMAPFAALGVVVYTQGHWFF